MIDLLDPKSWVLIIVVCIFAGMLYYIFRLIVPELTLRVRLLFDEDKYN